jgi:hypothetical protein
MGKTQRASSLCREGYHSWEALLQPGWFECRRCGVHAVCGHVRVVPSGVLRLACAESCFQVGWQGYRR